MNKFSELHDDERIVFCKIDHVIDEFKRVASLPHNVVMLIMNGDLPFTESKFKYKPDNVKHIFATNSTVYNNIVTPTINQNTTTNDKNEFDNLMSEYFNKT
jgi:hypothetical protein